MHKFDSVKFQEQQQAKSDLQKPSTPPTTVVALRARVDLLEKLLGLK